MTNLIVLLGRRDVPTDGVADYCGFLGAAMEAKGYKVEIARVPWEELGWTRAWKRLWQESREWQEKRVLVQYTALMWSRRGLPLPFLAVLLTLKVRGVRVIPVFHDFAPYEGKRWVDGIRRACQLWVLRGAYWWTRVCVFPVPKEQVSWLPRRESKAQFIPVGPGVPAMPILDRPTRKSDDPRTIVVFVVTDGGDIGQEVVAITDAAKAAAARLGKVRLVTLGRGSTESESLVRQALAGSAVEFRALGVLPPVEVSKVLSGCDASLFVRGRISTQRSSAVACIACALPLVTYAEGCLPPTLEEAGVVGVRHGDRQALAEAVVQVLTNDSLWLELHHRSLRTYERYLSWGAIAGRFAELLGHA